MSQRKAWAVVAKRFTANVAANNAALATESARKPAKAPRKAVRRGVGSAQTVLDPFLGLCRAAGLVMPVPEFRFAPPRRWRFDYAWPNSLIALEVEGGVWTQGRHTRATGFLGDMAKYNAAALLGWRVLRTTPSGLKAMLMPLKTLVSANPSGASPSFVMNNLHPGNETLWRSDDGWRTWQKVDAEQIGKG